MTNIIQDVTRGRLHSAYVVAPFDEGKEALEREGYRIISLEEQARLRIQEGLDAIISRMGNWTREGFIYIPKRGVFLSKNSPIMTNANEVTNCHRNSRDFYLNDEQVEKALADSVKISETEIPTSDFANRKLTSYAFGKDAREYGEFLRELGIESIQVYLAKLQKKPFSRQAWLFGLVDDLGSLFVGFRNLLFGDFVVYGVRDGTDEESAGVTQRISVQDERKIESYTPAQLRKALGELKLSGLEESIIRKLRQ